MISEKHVICRTTTRTLRLSILALGALLLMACAATFAVPKLATAAMYQRDTAQCASCVDLYGFSDALNKRTFKDTNVGGLSGLTYDNGQPFTGANFEGEGIALTLNGELLISSETEPSIRSFALDRSFLGELFVPERFLVQGGGANQPDVREPLAQPERPEPAHRQRRLPLSRRGDLRR